MCQQNNKLVKQHMSENMSTIGREMGRILGSSVMVKPATVS